MFDVGLSEMAVIALIAVLVFGPDKLPEFARQAGHFLRRLRDFATSTRDELRSELGPEFSDLELRDHTAQESVADAVAGAAAILVNKLRITREILEAADRTRCGPVAPADGLFLERVDYGTG